MNKVYIVKHCYEVDGGFGDAIYCEDTVVVFSTREKADEFVEKYSKPHVYDIPYACLTCGKLEVMEMNIDEEPKDTDDFWWLTNEVIDMKEGQCDD